MKSSDLKEYIIEQNCIDTILEDLGCGNIVFHGGYYTCSNPDGNNKSAVTIYVDNLIVVNYTRCIAKNKRATDLFDLVAFYRDCSFPESLKYIHGILGLDYYQEREEPCESLQILRMLKDMQSNDGDEKDEPLKPISEAILDYYIDAGNVLFLDDGISLETQNEWEIKFDPQTNSVCIPIRDELGTLIAVKARRFKYTPNTPLEQRRFPDELSEDESKYFFLEPGAKSQVLYGLYKNAKAIQQQGIVYVGESEKFTLQLYEMGYYGVSTGGSKVSKRQVEMLTRLGVKICFCFDKDQTEIDIKHIADMFMNGIDIYAILDRDGLLNSKESPSDKPDVWYKMVKNNIYKIK